MWSEGNGSVRSSCDGCHLEFTGGDEEVVTVADDGTPVILCGDCDWERRSMMLRVAGKATGEGEDYTRNRLLYNGSLLRTLPSPPPPDKPERRATAMFRVAATAPLKRDSPLTRKLLNLQVGPDRRGRVQTTDGLPSKAPPVRWRPNTLAEAPVTKPAARYTVSASYREKTLSFKDRWRLRRESHARSCATWVPPADARFQHFSRNLPRFTRYSSATTGVVLLEVAELSLQLMQAAFAVRREELLGGGEETGLKTVFYGGAEEEYPALLVQGFQAGASVTVDLGLAALEGRKYQMGASVSVLSLSLLTGSKAQQQQLLSWRESEASYDVHDPSLLCPQQILRVALDERREVR